MRAHCSILYFRHTTGCFVPIHHMHRDDGEWHVARCVYAPLDGRQRAMVLHDGKICEEDGFMVHNSLRPDTVAHMSASSVAGRGRSADTRPVHAVQPEILVSGECGHGGRRKGRNGDNHDGGHVSPVSVRTAGMVRSTGFGVGALALVLWHRGFIYLYC